MGRTQRVAPMRPVLLTISMIAAILALPPKSFGQAGTVGGAAGSPDSGHCRPGVDPLGVSGCQKSPVLTSGGCGGNAGGALTGGAGCASHRRHGGHHVHTPHAPSGHAGGGAPKPQMAQ
jgi:hypothetical protein